MVRKLALPFTLLFVVSLSYYALNQSPESIGFHPEVAESELIDCALDTKICIINVAGELIHVSLSPKNLPALKPITLTLETSFDVKGKSRIWFQGRDMEMGRHLFQESKKQNNIQHFGGMIPICTVDQDMIWQLHIVLHVEGVWKEWVFELPAGNHDLSE